MAIIITGKTYDTVPKILGEINVKEEKKNQKWEIIAFVVVLIVLIVAMIFVIIKNL